MFADKAPVAADMAFVYVGARIAGGILAADRASVVDK